MNLTSSINHIFQKKEDGFIINSHTMGFNQKKKNISIEEIKELIQYSTLMNKTGILQISTENEIENLVPPSKRREFKEGEA